MCGRKEQLVMEIHSTFCFVTTGCYYLPLPAKMSPNRKEPEIPWAVKEGVSKNRSY